MAWIFTTVAAVLAIIFFTYVGVVGLRKKDKDKEGAYGSLGIAGIIFLGWAVVTAVMSTKIVEPGYQSVMVSFGDVHERTLDNGFNFKPPYADTINYYVKRQMIDMRNSDVATSEGVRALTSDRVSIWVDIAFPYSLNGKYANWIHENIGGVDIYKKELLIPAARASVKNAAAEMDWEQVAISNKEEFGERVRNEFVNLVRDDLMNSGMDENSAKAAFNVFPVQLRNVKIPDKLRNSVNERMSAKEDLKRQETLTEIAEEEANRRRNVGEGIALMIEALPDTHNAEEMAMLLHGIADVRRAKSLTSAIERDQIQWGLFTGSNAVPGANAGKK